ncbi:hypothetical protein [Pseudomonas sp. BMS12]|uniref:hypothetical protein n=1 Tax=Pseudomonas sp. BMS12 TaxID=1796033 RepID=UPI00083B2C5E|nr:hypothetical protein [Pseudomonas sp. BMS12]
MDLQFDHIAFNTPDGLLQLSLEKLLGVAPGPRPPFPFPGEWLYQGDQALVHLIQRSDLQGAQLSHLALRTNQPASMLLEHVRASGLPYRIAVVPRELTCQIFVTLPGGMVLELAAPMAGSEVEITHDYQQHQQAPA